MLPHWSLLIWGNAERPPLAAGQTGRVLKTIPIGDADDPRLADYTRLTDVSLRISLEAANGLFIAEGTKVIGRAVRAGYPVRSMLLAQSRAGDLDDLAAPDEQALDGQDVPAYVVPDEVA